LIIPLDRAHRVLLGTKIRAFEQVPKRIGARSIARGHDSSGIPPVLWSS
ncbi:unnamed protein product, partial [Rotaria sp. Silwood2]